MRRKIITGIAMMAMSLTVAAQTADKPFKGKFKSGPVVAEIDFYAPTVKNHYVDGCYGIIEGVYMNGNRVDNHEIEEVKSVDGNKAVVVYTCGFDYEGQPRTAVFTYDAATGTLKIENDPELAGCYQGETLTLKSAKASARKSGGKKGAARKKRR